MQRLEACLALFSMAAVIAGLAWATTKETNGRKSWGAVQRITAPTDQAIDQRASRVEALAKKLKQTVTAQEIEANTTLKEALEYFSQAFDLTILLDTGTFREEDGVEIEATPVRLPKLTHVPLEHALNMLLAQIPGGATFLIRPGCVEITTLAEAAPQKLLQNPVHATFQDEPLVDALRKLSDQTNVTIVVDDRVARHAKTPVTARLRRPISVQKAVGLLAGLVDLAAVRLGDDLYVTTRANAASLEAEEDRRLKSLPVIRNAAATSKAKPEAKDNEDSVTVRATFRGPPPTGGPGVSSRDRPTLPLARRLVMPITLEKGIDASTPLKDAVEYFMDHYDLTILVDDPAFRRADAKFDVHEERIVMPKLTNVALGTALRLMLDQVSGPGATFLTRGDHLLVVPLVEATPEKLLRRRIAAVFDGEPLADALKELGDRTGASLILDVRASEKAIAGVTAVFRNDVSLETAVRLLADMAGLKAVRVGEGLYITTRENANVLQADEEKRAASASKPKELTRPKADPVKPT